MLLSRLYDPPAPGVLRIWILPVLSGVLLALAFPCHPAHPLAFLFCGGWACAGLVPLLLALSGGSFKEGFHRGWLAGFVFNLLGLYWVAHTQGGGPAVVAGAFFMASYLALFTAAFAGVLNLLLERWGRWACLLAPVLWTGQEYLLSLGDLGFPWLLLGHSQAAYPALIQYATYTGVYGVSFWIAMLNVLLVLLLDPSASRSWRWGGGGALLPALLLPWLYGHALLEAEPGGEGVRIALIQSNLGLEKWKAGGLQRSFAILDSLSRRAAAQRPELLVWPETALPCYLALRPSCRRRLARLVDELDIPVLTGAPDYDPARKAAYNAAFFFEPRRAQWTTYAKMHLVPFGERTPFRDRIPFLRSIDWSALTGDLGPAEFSPGTRRTLFAPDRTPFAVLICFEAAFPDLVRRSVGAGARLLVNITNDSWFGPTAGPYQHVQLAILRAVENRTPIARCATGGISVFIDAFGRTSQATELFVPTFRVGTLSPGRESTFYTRHGDLFARLDLLAAFTLVALARVRRLK